MLPLPFLAALGSLWIRGPRREGCFVALSFVAGVYLLPYVLLAFYIRYLLPLLPILVLVAFIGLDQIAWRLKPADARPRSGDGMRPSPTASSGARSAAVACGLGTLAFAALLAGMVSRRSVAAVAARSGQPEAAGSIAGTVVDTDGQPIDDAWVMVSSAVATPEELRLLERHAGDPAVLRAFDAATSRGGVRRYVPAGASGRFDATGLPEGTYELRVFGPSGQRAWSRAVDKEAPDAPVLAAVGATATTEVRLAVQPCRGILRGTVAQADGTAATGAHVAAAVERVRSLEARDIASATVDGDGQFAFTNLCEGSYRLVARDPSTGGGASRRSVHLDATVALSLEAPSTLTGRVRLAGRPVRAFAYVLTGPDVRRHQARDDGGAFRIPDLVQGTHQLLVEADEGYALRAVELRKGAAEDLPIELSPWSSLEGRLVGGPLDAVAGADVTLYFDPADHASAIEAAWPAGERLRRTRTDALGRFAFDRLVARRAHLSFQSGDHEVFVTRGASGPPGAPSGPGRSMTIDLGAGETRRVTVEVRAY